VSNSLCGLGVPCGEISQWFYADWQKRLAKGRIWFILSTGFLGKIMDFSSIEKYSSAITLSDMEIFVFPELIYALVLANIMSPIIWQWRREGCFKKLEGKDSYKKLMRLRQYIMDNFDFNLDLETWGLTDKKTEIDRFKDFISPDKIAESNALFGYEGDKYYFDVDIRKHFGLDKYTTEAIPYWKTETVEAMYAFRHKQNYPLGAGECVSLSTLYAAAAFIVCGIPLKDIYMILTPLHSQNFIDIADGVLTNNRRLITKTMWFNGSEISNKAQRALRNENITIVAHNTGYIHCLYDKATIDKKRYEYFIKRLDGYFSAELTLQGFASFLRTFSQYQKFFQLCRDCHGQAQFLKAETLFHYEHNSKYRIVESTHNKLLEEVSDEDFLTYELPGRIRCDKFEQFLQKQKPDPRTAEGKEALIKVFKSNIPDAEQMVEKLRDYLHTEAKLPSAEKKYLPSKPIEIDVDMSREEIIDYLKSIRKTNAVADLAFYAFRDMVNCEWQPFVEAAIERNPVSIERYKEQTIEQVYEHLKQIDDESIYDAGRLAQPDEVVNYNRGDGLEKAFVLANVIKKREPEQKLKLTVDNSRVNLQQDSVEYSFNSKKGLKNQLSL